MNGPLLGGPGVVICGVASGVRMVTITVGVLRSLLTTSPGRQTTLDNVNPALHNLMQDLHHRQDVNSRPSDWLHQARNLFSCSPGFINLPWLSNVLHYVL